MTMPLPPSAGVIGWPVAHSKSPLIHRFWLQKLGIDGDYGRFAVTPGHLAAAIGGLAALGLRGVNVTIPHKIAVIDWLDDIDSNARAIGAVNTVYLGGDGRLCGINTDVTGILEPLAGCALAGGHAVIAGTGGAARAALRAMQLRDVGWVTILARDDAKAAGLLAEFGLAGVARRFDDNEVAVEDAVLFLNATSLGMAGQPSLLFDVKRLPETTTIFDAVYRPLITPLLNAAAARGMAVVDGLQMLIGQAATAFEVFYGAPAPRDHDIELRRLLTR